MSLKSVIREASAKNPMALKEAIDQLLSERILVALEEKVNDLQELSKKTLASYTNRAASSMGTAAHDLGSKKADADDVDRFTNRHMDNKYSMRDTLKKAVKADDESQGKLRRTIGKRLSGIESATKRLGK